MGGTTSKNSLAGGNGDSFSLANADDWGAGSNAGTARGMRSDMDDAEDSGLEAGDGPGASADAMSLSHANLVPTPFTWNFSGSVVEIGGAWDGWSTRPQLPRQGNEFSTILLLPVGRFQYKFVVDGEWHTSPSYPTERDENNNLNNVIDVKPHVNTFDNAEPPGAKPPLSPSRSYGACTPSPDEFSSAPPPLPPHFRETCLNKAPLGPAKLDVPPHVALEHLCSKSANEVRILSISKRYKTRFITTVIYSPSVRAGGP